MRYSELIGKEIVDLSEGIRLGAVIGSDLIIDTERGTIEALLIYQRRGLMGSREIKLAWSGIRSMGRDLILVDMIDVQNDQPRVCARQSSLRLPSQYLSSSEDIEEMPASLTKRDSASTVSVLHAARPKKHRVAGIDRPLAVPETDFTAEVTTLVPEDENQQLLLGQLARGTKREPISIWRRRKRRTNAVLPE